MKKLLALGFAGLLLSSSAYAVIQFGNGEKDGVSDRINIDIPTDTFTYVMVPASRSMAFPSPSSAPPA